MNYLSFMLFVPLLVQERGYGEPQTREGQIAMSEGQRATDENTLIVNVIPDTGTGGVLKSDLVKVSLVNAGISQVKVAGRLSIGYEDSDRRELYAIVRNRSTGEIVGKRSKLYEREPVHLNDVRILEIGETISTEFHLHEWCEIPEGDLEIQVVYDPSEAAKSFPEIQARIFASDFVTFLNKR